MFLINLHQWTGTPIFPYFVLSHFAHTSLLSVFFHYTYKFTEL
uniref:Uncharacterized protein n=1 Tax=Anguilla anguilla TaxID=7936 RepID=A0A0E9XAP7_ANGAN